MFPAATGSSRSRSVTHAAATAAPFRSAPLEAAVAEAARRGGIDIRVNNAALFDMAPIVEIQVARVAKLLKDRKITIELTDAAGRVVRQVQSDFDGYVLFDSVPYF